MSTPTYLPIATYQLSSPAASVTFGSIDQSFRDLVIVANATTPEVYVTFNGDTGSNYSVMWGLVYTATKYAGISNSQTKGALSRTAWGGNVVCSIMDYSQTNKNKNWHSQANGAVAANNALETITGRWASNSAITSITLQGLGAGNYPTGSSFTLFGIA